MSDYIYIYICIRLFALFIPRKLSPPFRPGACLQSQQFLAMTSRRVIKAGVFCRQGWTSNQSAACVQRERPAVCIKANVAAGNPIHMNTFCVALL